MRKTKQLEHISIYLFFLALLTFGLFHEGLKNDSTTYFFFCIITLLLALIIKKLSVWDITRDNDIVVFYSFFGLLKKVLSEKNDYEKVEGYVIRDPTTDFEHGEHLKLTTKKGVLRFNSKDYNDFEFILNEIFQERIDLKIDFKRLIKKDRKLHIDRTWIFYILVILLGFILNEILNIL